MSFNLATMLREAAARSPRRPCLSFDGRTLDYGEVDDLAGRVAGHLLASGLAPGDKVAVQLPNVPQFVIAYFGILRAGLVMVPLNPLLRGPEIAYHLTHSEARVLITGRPTLDEARRGVDQTVALPIYVVDPAAGVREPGCRPFDELVAAIDAPEEAATRPDDTAVLIYTSGTTGKPKGAELTHFQLLMNCTVAGELIGARPDDVAVGVLPLFHVFGLSSILNVAVRNASSIVLVPRFDPAAVLTALEQRRATVFAGVPTMYIALLGAADPGCDVSTLRIAVSGGAAMPGEVIRNFEARFPGVTILEGYGLSETASTATFNVSAEKRRVGSIGKAIWGVQLRIVDHVGNILPPGAGNVGEITIKGHNVMKGYYRDPDATAAVLQDGWLHTGDLGYLDEDGFVYIVDRLKDLIIRGGYNVYPREIEEVLYGHRSVHEAAVVGRPHDSLGEEVCAVVSLVDGATAGEQELIEYCKERLAAYKYPREIHILPYLPKGPTGKILKNALRAGG